MNSSRDMPMHKCIRARYFICYRGGKLGTVLVHELIDRGIWHTGEHAYTSHYSSKAELH